MTRRPTALAILLTAAALALAAAGPALAFRQPDPTPLTDKAYRHPDLYIGNVLKHPGELSALAVDRATGDLQSLGVAADHSRLDRRTGRWGTLILQQPLMPGDGNGLTWADLGLAEPRSYAERQAEAWNAFYGWVLENQLALRLTPAELRQPGHVTVHHDGDFVQIVAPRQIAGVPVRDSYLTAVISGGNLILFGAHNWGDVAVPPVAEISRAEATDRLLGHLAPHSPTGRLAPELEYIPLSRGGVDPAGVALGQGLEYRLAWVLRPQFPGTVAQWEGLVDARTGELIAFEDKANYGESTRSIIGGVYTVSNDGVFPDGIEIVYGMPYADVSVGGQDFFTDAGGNLAACVDGTITSGLQGRYVAMTDVCGAISESTAADVLDLGTSGGTDCVVPAGHSAGDTHATRSGFYELNQMHAMGRGHTPNNAAVNGTLPATMNINQTCNASGGAGGVNFFRSGGGCSNTGEIAGVFDHEWGHHMDALDANPGISNPGEGIADIYASLRLNSSCIGRNFRPGVPCGGYGDGCVSVGGEPACTGVRDIDFARRSSGNPHDIAFIDSVCDAFGSGAPCGGSVHCEGAVYGEAVWDLWNRDLPNLYGMSIDRAREIAARLTFLGGQLVGTWFNCINGAGTGDGCNANGGYLNYLAADDDDNDLSNGTPHMQAIFDAFDRHGIACSTPTVTDSGCAGAPTTAPVVTVTGLDRGVHLEWTAVAGASGYRVFRTQSDPLVFQDGFESGDTSVWPNGDFSCDFGKILIAETSGLSYTDTEGLTNGQRYHYQVFAMGSGDACYGPASQCRTALPEAGPNLAVLPGGTFTIQTGDADPFIDNCEEVDVSFEINNIGAGSQTDVRALSITSPSHPSIDSSITFPAQYAASLTACDTVSGTFTFVADGLSPNDTVEFQVEVTSDELDAQLSGQSKGQSYAQGFTESDLQAQATRLFDFESDLDGWTVESGTFNRMSGGGGDGTTWRLESSAFLHNQCDKIRSPVLQIQSTSTLSLWNNYDIEPLSGGTWYDRANVAVVGLDGSRTVVEPDGGRTYNAGPGGPGNFTGCNDGETGWADANASWGTSTWSDTEFGQMAPAGLSQIEVTYSTDAALAELGFWFDEVEATDVSEQVADTQSDVCP